MFKLILSFLKIGLLNFGGGAPMIGFFSSEIVANAWTSVLDGYHTMVAVAQLIPGPFGVDATVYIGYKIMGLLGAVVAALAISIPMFFVILFIAHHYDDFKKNRYIQSFLRGLRPIVIALLVLAIIRIFPIRELAGHADYLFLVKTLVLFFLGFSFLIKFRVNSFFYFFIYAVFGVFLL